MTHKAIAKARKQASALNQTLTVIDSGLTAIERKAAGAGVPGKSRRRKVAKRATTNIKRKKRTTMTAKAGGGRKKKKATTRSRTRTTVKAGAKTISANDAIAKVLPVGKTKPRTKIVATITKKYPNLKPAAIGTALSRSKNFKSDGSGNWTHTAS